MSVTVTAPASIPTERTTRVDQHAGIPFLRLVGVELRKMFDTRAGFWMMASVALVSIVASILVIAVAGREHITLDSFSQAFGQPLAVILPLLAVMAVTAEYSQRTGLMTYALVPTRSRVIAAKLVTTAAVGVTSMALAFGIGALANIVGALMLDVDPGWNVTADHIASIVLAHLLGMLMGFTFGALVRSTAVAVVLYLVYFFVVPNLLFLLAAQVQWYADAQPWVDFLYNVLNLFEVGLPSGEGIAHLATSSVIWLWIPLAVGWRLLVRSEVT